MSVKVLCLIVLGIFFSSLVFPSSSLAISSGLFSGEFLNIVPDPRTAALGGQAVGEVADNAASAINNPASLLGITRPRLSLNYTAFSPDLSYNFVGYAFPTAYGAIGGSLVFLNYGSIDGYDNTLQKTNIESSYDIAAVMSYAFPLRATIPVFKEFGAVGINLKLMQSKLSYYAKEAVAVDVGGIYNISFLPGLSAGVSYRNLGSGMKFVKESNPLPTSLNLGLSYRNASFNNLSLVLDINNPDQGMPSVSGGISISPIYFFTVHAGWKQSFDSLLSNFRSGVSLELGDFAFDYTFIPSRDLTPTHYLGVNMAIGNILRLEKASDHYLARHFREACAYYYRKDYIEARQKFEEILSVYPDHRLSQQYLEKIIAAIDTMEQEKENMVKRWLRKAQDAITRKDFITANTYLTKVRTYEIDNAMAGADLREIEEKLNAIKSEKDRQKNSGKIEKLWKEGLNYYLKGDFVKAKRKFTEILAIDPDNVKTKEYVVEIDNQLTKVAASKVNELYEQGMALYKEGNYAEAGKYFEAVAIAAPNRIDAQELIAKCQQNVRDREEKQKAEEIARAQEKMNNQMESVYKKAVKQYEHGNYEEALENFVKGQEIANRYGFREYQDNITTYVANIKSSLAERYYKIGFSYFRKNNFEGAAAAYRKALTYNPDHAPARFELERMSKDLAKKYYEAGMSYFGRSEIDRAKEMFRKSLMYDPNKVESIRALERIK